MEGKESGVRPQVLTHQRASDVCMTKATLTQLATVLALFFVTLLTLSGVVQRRYYLDKLSKHARDELQERSKY